MPTIEFVCEDNFIWSPLAAALGHKLLEERSLLHSYCTRYSGIRAPSHSEAISPLKMWAMIHAARQRNDFFEEQEISQADAFLEGGDRRSVGGFAAEKLYQKAFQTFEAEQRSFRAAFLHKEKISEGWRTCTEPQSDVAIIFCKEESHVQDVRRLYQPSQESYLQGAHITCPPLHVLTTYVHNVPRKVPEFSLGGTREEYYAMARQLSSDVWAAINLFLQECRRGQPL
ncbi:MAG: hypothetical protein AABY00_02895 [Nanoarchaeota archaeon]